MTRKKCIAIPMAFVLMVILLSAQRLTSQKSFSKEQVLEDIDYLVQSLEKTHYNLYAYTHEDVFKESYRTVRETIQQDSFNLLEATSLFQKVISKAKNGHTEIFFPTSSYVEFVYGGGSVFPLELAFENGSALVRKNWSGKAGIEPGHEVVSINGRSIADILEAIGPHISAERPYFKKAKIELYSFPRLYWQVFREQQNFEVGIRSSQRIVKHQLPAANALEGYESRRKEVLNSKKQLAFYGENAYLNPGGFSGDFTEYKSFIDSSFAAIKSKDSPNLILDLRNHPGGDDTFGDYLVSYIADRPFRWNSSFSLKTSELLKEDIRKTRDTTKAFWKSALTHENGERYPYTFKETKPQALKKRFNRKVYVLVNRQSHSQAAVTAAQIKDYGFATLVGEETGDYPSLYASVFRYPLPNTGIEVQVSKGYITRVSGSRQEKGVVPDIRIRDHLLDEEDEILNSLLQSLGQQP